MRTTSNIGSSHKNLKPLGWLSDDVVRGVKADVESNVSAKMDGLKEPIAGLLLCCEKERVAGMSLTL